MELADRSAFCTLVITRALARNNTTTMSVGITVHAISTWLLPYTCAGSLPSSSGRLLNVTTAYTSSAQTHTKITAVTPSTSVDSPKIAAAGVDAGAKMLVGLIVRLLGGLSFACSFAGRVPTSHMTGDTIDEN